MKTRPALGPKGLIVWCVEVRVPCFAVRDIPTRIRTCRSTWIHAAASRRSTLRPVVDPEHLHSTRDWYCVLVDYWTRAETAHSNGARQST